LKKKHETERKHERDSGIPGPESHSGKKCRYFTGGKGRKSTPGLTPKGRAKKKKKKKKKGDGQLP